ncbi:MAG: RNA-binding protein [Firmicutes bacterium]|nr:RNA-binding protein [Bacillota bacterium]
MEYTQGQVVYSKSGRDKTLPFVVLSIDKEYLILADGKKRTLEHPKRKKNKHVQKTNYICEEIRDRLINNGYLLNSDIRKALKNFGARS